MSAPTTKEPPTRFLQILRHIGPGLILAGSIVGSGELIATTRTGAEAGFSFLWLIIFGCVVKVFTQIELGRYAISSSKTTLDALNDLPGPRLTFPTGGGKTFSGNWVTLVWLAMFLTGLGQLGGIVGGVGQALAISWPLTEAGQLFNDAVEAKVQLQVLEAGGAGSAEIAEAAGRVAQFGDPVPANDAKIWAAIMTAATIVLLLIGSFGFIEAFCMALVGGFTLVTVINLFALQSHDSWAISWAELREGLSFGLPDAKEGSSPLKTALMTFGIIGVGAAELVGYPYWCLEKGYGVSIGKPDGSDSWATRAKGWLRVMKVDAWLSMFIYTFCTVAFYLLGAAILGRTGLLPEGAEMIRTLSVMYEPVFGKTAQIIFLVGAFAVLFSTFFVALAMKARLATDALVIFGLAKFDDRQRARSIKVISVIFPIACLLLYLFISAPVTLVLASGFMQAILLPLLGFAVLWFRYKLTDERLRSKSRFWDVMLWLSFASFLVIGIYLCVVTIGKALGGG